MDKLFTIDDRGTVLDSTTGQAYGRVTRGVGGEYWIGQTVARVGMPADTVHRATRRAAAIAVVSTYVLGPER